MNTELLFHGPNVCDVPLEAVLDCLKCVCQQFQGCVDNLNGSGRSKEFDDRTGAQGVGEEEQDEREPEFPSAAGYGVCLAVILSFAHAGRLA